MLAISATGEVEIRRKKLARPPSQETSWALVVHFCNPSYMGSIGMRIMV
jgi:hypothetical protein